MSTSWVDDKNSFKDFLIFVAHYAPDFPEEDYLEPENQLNLDMAFQELFNGLTYIKKQVSEQDFLDIDKRLHESQRLYNSGDDIKGSHIIQNIYKQLFK